MNDRQKIVCAIALFCDGWSHEQIARALEVTTTTAAELIDNGADQMREHTLGFMSNTKVGDRVVIARADDGTILDTELEPGP